jgi:hypothetical protein
MQGRKRLPSSLLPLARAPRRAAAAPSLLALSAGGLPPRCRRGALATWSVASAAGAGCAHAGALDRVHARQPGRRHAGLQQLCAHLRAGSAAGSCMVGQLSPASCIAQPCAHRWGWAGFAWRGHAESPVVLASVTSSCQPKGLRLNFLRPCGEAPGHLLNACEQTTAKQTRLFRPYTVPCCHYVHCFTVSLPAAFALSIGATLY